MRAIRFRREGGHPSWGGTTMRERTLPFGLRWVFAAAAHGCPAPRRRAFGGECLWLLLMSCGAATESGLPGEVLGLGGGDGGDGGVATAGGGSTGFDGAGAGGGVAADVTCPVSGFIARDGERSACRPVTQCALGELESEAPSPGRDRACRPVITSGRNHTCELLPDRTVRCFGSADWGILQDPSVPVTTFPPPGERWAMVDAGWRHTCGIRSGDRSAVCWGDTRVGDFTPPPGVAFASLSAGAVASCGVRQDDRTLECWGRPVGWLPEELEDVPVSTVSVGEGGCALLEADGSLVCWENGTLSRPAGHLRFTSISVGWGVGTGAVNAVCGITVGGELWCLPGSAAGVAMPEGRYQSVSVSEGFACGVRADDFVADCWGRERIGNSRPGGRTAPPFSMFTRVSAGGGHACGVRAEDGRVVCWGAGHSEGDFLPRGTPSVLQGQLSAGPDHTCVLRPSGQSECWGTMNYASLAPAAPVALAALSSGWVNCGLRGSDRAAVCWERTGDVVTPGPFDSLSVGWLQVCAIESATKLVRCWGPSSGNFEAKVLSPETQLFAVASGRAAGGSAPNCGIRALDGRIECWAGDIGDASPGDEGPFAAVSGTCGLVADSREPVCWRDARLAAAAPREALLSLSVSPSYGHACGVRLGDRSLVCWGNDDAGQSTPPAGVAFASVVAGARHSCGVRLADGGIECWGDNSRRQLCVPGTTVPGCDPG